MGKAERRHERIREYLGERTFVSTHDLAQAVDTSEVTLRRDLRYLEQLGIVVREHGGARLVVDRLAAEERFAARELRNPESKAQIGHQVAAMIEHGEHVAMNDGTTIMQVALAIRATGVQITATTNALNIAATLSDSSTVDVYALGGLVRRASFGTYSPSADALDGQRFDTAVLGIESMSLDGIALDHPFDLAIARAMIERSERVVIAADASKWHRRGRMDLAGWDAIDVLVTDTCPQNLRSSLAELGVQVITTLED